jgi:RNA polymerase sigma-70 factor (ECF subfamily)
VESADATVDFDDAALARRIAAGASAAEAETEFCRRFAPRIRLYGLRHLRDAQAAADLAQQVLLMTLERLRAGRVRDPAAIASFVLGTCRLVVTDLKRTQVRRERLLGAVPMQDEAVEPVADRIDDRRLRHCLERLAERERAVLVMTFCEDRDAREVAAELALSEGNVRVIRHRGLERLRRCMDGAR